MKDLYLNSAAHQPMSKRTIEAYINFNNSLAGHGHPSAPGCPDRKAADALENARDKIAELIGAKSQHQIIFTNSCTEACAWALEILFKINQDESIAVSPVEHPAVSEAFYKLYKNYFHNSMSKLPVDENGTVQNTTVFNSIAVIQTQNETGVISPIEDLSAQYIFSDMSQSLGKIPINITELNVDIAAFGAHKFGGPSGIGFMYLKDPSMWQEFGTGSRYFTDIPGTPNVIGAVTTAVALEEAIETLPERTENMNKFQHILESGLKKLGFKIIGEGAKRSPSTSFVQLPKNKESFNPALDLLLDLGDEYRIFVATGSACNSIHTGSSKIVQALNLPSNGLDLIRFSQFGFYSAEEANFVLTRIQNMI